MITFTPEDIFLVTGASSGLGAAGALLLNRLGATVIAAGRDAERLEALRARCAVPGNWHSERRDLAQTPDTLCDWVKSLKERHGKLRGLLHCAGVCEVVPVRMQESDGLRALFEINVFAAYQVARGFLDRRNNTGPGASIVFIASSGALRDNAGISSYSASKGAIISLTHSMACEFLPQKIRVNCLSPGLVPTPMTMGPDIEERTAAYPLGPATPEDVAHAAAFLLSDAARWITGQNIILDGGRGLL